MAKKKLGRPTDNPKTAHMQVRLDKETLNILDEHCKKNNLTRSQGIRDAIRKLDEK